MTEGPMTERPMSDRDSAAAAGGGRWIAALPLIAFVGLAGLFALRLYSGDPSVLPSALIGHPAPAFNLPALPDSPKPGLADADLRKGQTTVVNMFASWCGPCRIEHPMLKRLSENQALKAMGVRLVGVDYKDDPANAKRFLAGEGDPYAAIGADQSGRVGIDWGLTGVPETFIVRGDGTIAFKYTGPITEQALNDIVLPEIEKTLR
jgi:cytochrome c biogenesis protein CcmG/thiol:disulfide interchange protein DsbE